MAYGILKCDTVTFTNAGVDKSVSISGLVQNPTFSGNVTVTGTLSGVTVTGTTASFTSGNFTNISGGTHTITSGVFALGSAANPSISFTSDPNTGIYSPGADQVAISTNGTGRLFVDASGNIGVGATPTGANLDASQSGTSSAGSVVRVYNRTDGTSQGYISLIKFGSAASAYGPYSANSVGINSTFTQLNLGTETAHALVAYTNNTERLRVTSDGKVGLGTSSPSELLHVNSSGNTKLLVSSTFSGSTSTAVIVDTTGDTSIGALAFRKAGVARGDIAYRHNATAGSERLSFNVAGGERLSVLGSGNVGVGTTSPTQPLQVVGNTRIGATTSGTQYSVLSVLGDIAIMSSSPLFNLTAADGSDRFAYINHTGAGGQLDILNQKNGALTLGTNNLERARIDSSGTFRIKGAGTAGVNDAFAVNGSAPANSAQIDSSGRLLVGTSSTRSVGTVSHPIQQETPSGTIAGLSIVRNSADGAEGRITFGKTRSTTVGGTTAVVNGDYLGTIAFAGANGSDLNNLAASIAAIVDGDPTQSSTDLPGRLVFSTTADGASSPTERMRIGQNGFLKASNSGSYIGVSAAYHELVSNQGSAATSLLVANTNATGNGTQISVNSDGTNYAYLSGFSISAAATRIIIWSNGNVVNTNNSYGAISDAKLKENIVDAGSQWADIRALQVRKYNFKEGQTHTQIGLVAQEVELVSPGLVTESPDRDTEGNDLGTVTKSVNYSVLYMKAVKALQEAMERIETLEAKVAALESA